MKATPTRISYKLINEYGKLYTNYREGIERSLEGYLLIRERSIRRLKGLFSNDELSAMIDSFNGTMMLPEFMTNTSIFLAHMEDSFKMDYLSDRWGINCNKLTEKLKGLNDFDTYVLQEEIYRFWNEPRAYNNNLNEFLERLSVKQ